MKPNKPNFKSLATSLVVGPGDGVPRARETLIAEVERTLASAYASGIRDAWALAKERAMREVVACLQASAQSLMSRVVEIERDLLPPCECDSIPCMCWNY